MREITNTQHLVVCVMGLDKPGIVNALLKMIAQSNCNVLESDIITLGQEFSATFLLTGAWSAIAKVETNLPGFAKKYQLGLLQRRTEAKHFAEPFLPYTVYIAALDTPGILAKLTEFFGIEQININKLITTSYLAPYTQAAMVAIHLSISIPASLLIADLRERFMLFCDDHNLDVVLEPDKG